MTSLRAFSLLLAAASMPAGAAVTVETAAGDWSKLPQLSQRGYNHLSEKMQAKLYEIAESKQCPAFGLKDGRLDFSVTFAVQYAPDGSLARVVMPKLDCPEAESIVGGTLLEMLEAGDYAPTAKSPAGWHKGVSASALPVRESGRVIPELCALVSRKSPRMVSIRPKSCVRRSTRSARASDPTASA